MKSEKSVAEIEMKEILTECEDIVDDSYLTTQDARKILDKGYKILQACERLRKGRDNWRTKFETQLPINTNRNKEEGIVLRNGYGKPLSPSSAETQIINKASLEVKK